MSPSSLVTRLWFPSAATDPAGKSNTNTSCSREKSLLFLYFTAYVISSPPPADAGARISSFMYSREYAFLCQYQASTMPMRRAETPSMISIFFDMCVLRNKNNGAFKVCARNAGKLSLSVCIQYQRSHARKRLCKQGRDKGKGCGSFLFDLRGRRSISAARKKIPEEVI